MESREILVREGLLEGGRPCKTLVLRRPVLGFDAGDLLLVVPGAEAEGGELVVDSSGRVGRHGGGPIWGVIVGAVRRRVLGRGQTQGQRRPAPPRPLSVLRLDPRGSVRGWGAFRGCGEFP